MNTKYIIFSLVGILLIGSLSGCSLIGLGIGTLIDNGNSHDAGPIFSNIEDAKGQPATIQFRDSVSYATFTGYSDEPEDSYNTYYNNYLKTHPVTSTAIHLGDTVVTQSLSFTGVFEGYAPEGIFLSGKQYRFSKFDNIISPHRVSTMALQSLYAANVLPIRAKLNFQDKNNTFSLTNRDFQNVMVPGHSGNMKWILFGIGAAIDVTDIILFIVGLNRYPYYGSFASTHYTGGASPQAVGLKFTF